MSEKFLSIPSNLEATPSITINDGKIEGESSTNLVLQDGKFKSNTSSIFPIDDNSAPRIVSVFASARHISNLVDYEKLLIRFKACLAIIGFGQQSLSEEHLILVKEFLLSPTARKLVIYIDDNRKPHQMTVVNTFPSQAYAQMAYFIKELVPKDEALTDSNFERKVQFGKLTKNNLDSLLKIMSRVYVPIFSGNKKWPETVRKEFNTQLYKFMVHIDIKLGIAY
jgi:dynein heavy chain, axonemal